MTAVLARELHGAHLQHARAAAGKLEHIVVADDVKLLCARAHARIGGVDAVHVGIYLAHIGANAPCHRHRRGVGATAPERGNIAVGVNALKTRDHGNGARIERFHDALVVHLHDLGLRVGAVGLDTGLAPREAHRLVAARLDGHGKKRHGNLLASGKQAVHFARRRILVQGGGKPHQLVGRFPHSRNHRNHLVSRLLTRNEALGHHLNALGRRHRGAAEFAYDQRHGALSCRGQTLLVFHYTKPRRRALRDAHHETAFSQ